MKDSALDNTNFVVGKNLEGKGRVGVDMNNVVDLFDDEGMFEEIKREGNIILD